MAALAEPLNYANYGYGTEHIDLLQKRKFIFSPATPVSRKSLFGGTIWDYTDETNERLKVLDDCKLTINWEEVTKGTAASDAIIKKSDAFVPVLPDAMIEDIKIGVFMYALFPQMTNLGRASGARKAITVVAFADSAIRVFSHLYASSRLSAGGYKIEKLSDIRWADVVKYMPDYPFDVVQAKKVLQLFAMPDVSENLKYGRIQWNALDITKSHKIKWPEKGKEPGHYETLPNELFRLLSNTSSAFIGDFLFNLGIELNDAQAGAGSREELGKKWPRFKEMFESYVERRKLTRDKGSGWASRHTKVFKKKFGFNVDELGKFLFTVQAAAQLIILLYTGMRYSEAATIKKGCLITRNGVWLIKSTLIKAVPSNLPLDDDEWVAIDIVRDAVRALEELSRCTFNGFLFSNFDTVRLSPSGLRGHETPLSDGGLNDRMTQYLREIDIQSHWTGWEMTEHQCRHGLVHQLARAEVGLPYITRQLKHKHGLLAEGTYRINPTTTIYGMQKERLMANATGLNAMMDAKVEVIMDLYGEGKKFAGPAAPAHQQRTEAFFEGQGLHGKDRERYLRGLARSGIQVVKTGIGFCTRNHADPTQLKEYVPPCLGDLECNPHTCKHSLVPERNAPIVINLYKDTMKNLSDPEMAHLQQRNERQKDSLQAMLGQLGIDPEKV